jgi:hypothetical protein
MGIGDTLSSNLYTEDNNRAVENYLYHWDYDFKLLLEKKTDRNEIVNTLKWFNAVGKVVMWTKDGIDAPDYYYTILHGVLIRLRLRLRDYIYIKGVIKTEYTIDCIYLADKDFYTKLDIINAELKTETLVELLKQNKLKVVH